MSGINSETVMDDNGNFENNNNIGPLAFLTIFTGKRHHIKIRKVFLKMF